MKTIISTATNPHFNLAWEEYIFKHVICDEDILLLWRNEPSVIVGRNQTIFGEVNVDFCNENHIPIIRRISGGGTVYHDLGNLNFSVMTSHYKDVLSNYPYFTKPIIDFLKELGVDATFSGKSDIVISNQKISGNAQIYHQKRMLHHGTILFSSDLEKLNQVLKKPSKDIETMAVPSNRSHVTTVRSQLKYPLSFDEFREKLHHFWLKDHLNIHNTITLTEDDFKKIESIRLNKYQSWTWNYGEAPAFEIIKNNEQFSIRVKIHDGIVTHLEYTNGIAQWDLNQFNGIRFDKTNFSQIFDTLEDQLKSIIEPFKDTLFQ